MHAGYLLRSLVFLLGGADRIGLALRIIASGRAIRNRWGYRFLFGLDGSRSDSRLFFGRGTVQRWRNRVQWVWRFVSVTDVVRGAGVGGRGRARGAA